MTPTDDSSDLDSAKNVGLVTSLKDHIGAAVEDGFLAKGRDMNPAHWLENFGTRCIVRN